MPSYTELKTNKRHFYKEAEGKYKDTDDVRYWALMRSRKTITFESTLKQWNDIVSKAEQESKEGEEPVSPSDIIRKAVALYLNRDIEMFVSYMYLADAFGGHPDGVLEETAKMTFGEFYDLFRYKTRNNGGKKPIGPNQRPNLISRTGKKIGRPTKAEAAAKAAKKGEGNA